jgi:hypothetical protein
MHDCKRVPQAHAHPVPSSSELAAHSPDYNDNDTKELLNDVRQITWYVVRQVEE